MTAVPTISLETIRRPVENELRTFDRLLREAMRSPIPLVDLIVRYLARQKGKRVRPLLVLLSAKLCGGITERTYRGASLIEMLHTATLIHDDVVDDADLRRGVASINAVWKNKIAVLMGDYLLSRGLLLALQHNDVDFLHSTSQAVKRMTEGELLQIQKSRQLNTDESTYFEIIKGKTAALFSACTEIGAASATNNSDAQQFLRTYGEKVGIVFQISDDLLDYTGRRTLLGKPTAADIKDKKLTLPLIIALKNAEPKDSKTALKKVKHGATAADIEWLLSFVQEHKGIEYSLLKAQEIAREAQEQLNAFPDSDTKQSLLDFVTFVLQRRQ